MAGPRKCFEDITLRCSERTQCLRVHLQLLSSEELSFIRAWSLLSLMHHLLDSQEQLLLHQHQPRHKFGSLSLSGLPMMLRAMSSLSPTSWTWAKRLRSSWTTQHQMRSEVTWTAYLSWLRTWGPSSYYSRRQLPLRNSQSPGSGKMLRKWKRSNMSSALCNELSMSLDRAELYMQH